MPLQQPIRQKDGGRRILTSCGGETTVESSHPESIRNGQYQDICTLSMQLPSNSVAELPIWAFLNGGLTCNKYRQESIMDGMIIYLHGALGLFHHKSHLDLRRASRKKLFYTRRHTARNLQPKMHLSLPLLSLLPLTTYALQTIYLGTRSVPGQQPGSPGRYIAWFSDSDPCNDGVKAGELPFGFPDCYQPLTILGHTNITFTGCNTDNHSNSYPTLPTGVNDNGVPALQCVVAENPPSAPGYEDGRYEDCDLGDDSGIVQVVEYCS